MLALSGQFMLVALGADCNCDLPRDQLRKLEILLIIGAGLISPDAQDPESLMRSGQRQDAKRASGVIAQNLCYRETGLLLKIVNNQGLLVFPYPSGDRTFYRDLRRRLPQSGFTGLENLQSHHIARSIVQIHTQILKVQKILQTASKVMKQVSNVTMRRDGF